MPSYDPSIPVEKTPQILIIDDTLANLKLLADIISQRGYEVRPATSGKLALKAVEAELPDLVLLDVMMPEMDGYEVCRRLKADERFAGIPVIFISGLGEVEDKLTGFEVGGVDYISKPFRNEEVVARIETHLSLSRLRNHLASQNRDLQREVAKREKAEAKLQRLYNRLKALYELSSMINRSIELDELLSDVLRILTDSRIFSFTLKGAIFLIEGDNVRLASAANLSRKHLNQCATVKLDECLCGLACKVDEVMVSADRKTLPRHLFCNPELENHGQIIVPLKAYHRLNGILVLYTGPNYEVSEETIDLLKNVGSQIGIAVHNAQLYEETKRSSLHDPLTGLANRRFLEIELEKWLKAAVRYDEPLSLIIFDIDHFKHYNDTYGHVEGDKVLVELTEILVREIRKNDLAFRYGGEEFLVLLPRTDQDKAFYTAERLRQAVSSQSDLTISLGIASYERGEDKKTLIRRADEALYRAKQKGRNRVEVH